jgi:hypothetical protein
VGSPKLDKEGQNTGPKYLRGGLSGQSLVHGIAGNLRCGGMLVVVGRMEMQRVLRTCNKPEELR